MIELDYLDKQFDAQARAALEKGETVGIRVPSGSAASVKKALPLYSDYFALRQKGKRDRILLAKFGWYGIRTPTLWCVIIKAKLMNRDISMHERGGELFLTIAGN